MADNNEITDEHEHYLKKHGYDISIEPGFEPIDLVSRIQVKIFSTCFLEANLITYIYISARSYCKGNSYL